MAIPPENIILGNGSDEIFDLVVRTSVTPGDEILLPEPTFAFYRIAAQAHGATCRTVPLNEYRIDLTHIAEEITPRTRLIFLCNPNNPTGTIFTYSEFSDFIGRIPPATIVVVDETYGDYVTGRDYPRFKEYQDSDRWIVTTKTFSKFYGLAGLRVGFGITRRELVEQMNKIRQPFNVSLLALVGAEAALGDMAHKRATARTNAEGKAFLYEAFTRLGLVFTPSEANFILVDIGTGAREVTEWLLNEGIVVRGMAGYGLPGHVRVTIGLPEENRRLVAALQQWNDSYQS
jgi:histidinol-phosphate aminotransferase